MSRLQFKTWAGHRRGRGIKRVEAELVATDEMDSP